MIVLACGGREYGDVEFVYVTLDRLHAEQPITLLIEGGARGADTIAHAWALSRDIPFRRFKITQQEWRRLGKAAGPIRNRVMLKEGKPELVVAFPGGPGTADMVAIASAAGVKVIQFHTDGTVVVDTRDYVDIVFPRS